VRRETRRPMLRMRDFIARSPPESIPGIIINNQITLSRAK